MKFPIRINKLTGFLTAMMLSVGLMLGLGVTPADAATWTVTNANDSDGSANDLTLRYAITNAQAGDTINFAPNLSGRCYYTTDGSDPTISGTRQVYTGPITISQPVTVKAANYYTATDSWSSVTTAAYTTALTDIPMLSLTGGDFAGGSFASPQSVTLTKPEGLSTQWSIGYTTDGSDPKISTTKRLYNGPITVSKSETVKAVILNFLFQPSSEVASATFSFNSVILGQAPGISPSGGNFTPGQKVCIFDRAGTIHLSRALPVINQNLTINGPGADKLTIDGNNLYRGFQVDGGSVSISGLTIANGKAVGSNGTNGEDGVAGGGGGGGAAGGGGGLLVRGGSVNVVGVTFLNNAAYGGNGGNGGMGWITGGSGIGGNGGTSDLAPSFTSSSGGTGNSLDNNSRYIDGTNYSGGGGGYGRNNTDHSAGLACGGEGAAGDPAATDDTGTTGIINSSGPNNKHTNGTKGGNGGTGGYYGGNSNGAYGGNGGNGGDGYGGAVCLTFGSLAMVNCTFVGNQAVGGAGGHPGESNYAQGTYHDFYYGCGGNGGNSRGGAVYIGSYVNTVCAVNIVNCTFNSNIVRPGYGGTAPVISFDYAFFGTVGQGDYNALCTYGETQIYATNNTGLVDHNANLLQPPASIPAASQVFASTNLVTADGVSTSTITVRLYYASENAGNQLLFGALVTLSQGSGSSAITPASAITNNIGEATFTVTNTKAETVTYRGTDGFGITVNQTATVNFLSGPVNAGKSAVTASPLIVKADGTSVSTIKVILKDACGNLVGSNKQVTLSQNGSSVITPVNSGRTDSNSTATFTVTNNVAETVTYTARDTTDNVTLTQMATVAFTPFDWVVTDLSDNGVSGTLRYALTNAPSGATITFDSFGTITLGSPLPVITKNLTIYGPGADLLTISGDNQFSIFQVNSGTVSIKGLTLANGKAAGENGADRNETGGAQSGKSGSGGGLLVNGGTVSIENVDFLNNQAIGGSGGNGINNGYSGASGGTGSGGAIYLTNGTLTIANCLFDGNLATGGNGGNGGNGGSGGNWGGSGGGSGYGNGGAIYVNGGSLTVNNSRFSNGKATGGNGGSAGSGSQGSNGTVGGNGNGGAIYVSTGTLTVNNSQFSNDLAAGGKGGNGTIAQYNPGANGGNGYGGAIYNDNGTLALTDIQLSGNSLTGGAPGTSPSGTGNTGNIAGVDIYNKNGPITITNVSFSSGNNSYYNPSPAAAGQSTVAASLTSVPGDGLTATTITVTLISANGSPLGYGRAVTLNQSNGGRSIITPVNGGLTDNTGKATFTVTDSHFETVTYTATVPTDNVIISRTAMVTFTAVDCSLINNLSDSGNYGTLRFALENAPSGTTITFLDGLTGTIPLDSMLPVINKNLTIDASGANVTISGKSLYRIFQIDGGTVTFKNFTVAGGKTNENGGGLLINDGTVTIDSVTFINNKVTGDNGTTSHGGTVYGGAIHIKNGSLIIKNSQFNGNSASGGAGGNNPYNYNNGGNGGSGYGGAISVNAGTVVITDSQFSDNSATGSKGGDCLGHSGGIGGSGNGGSIYVETGSLALTNSQFSGDSVTAGNGGTATYGDNGRPGGTARPGNALGANLYNETGTITLSNVTFDPGNNNYYNALPPHTGQSTVTAGLSSLQSDGVTASTITVTLKYADGSPGGSGKKVSLNQGTGRTVITPANSGLTDCNGMATFTVTDLYAETVTYTATDTTDNIIVAQTTPVTFLPPDTELSTVSASPSNVMADGNTTSTIRVTLKFTNGSPAMGKTVTLSQGSGRSIITPVNNGFTDSSGIATFTVTDIHAETVTYTARDTTDQETLTPTVTVTFLPPNAGQSTVTVNPNSVIANSSAVATVTVTMKYDNGSPAAGRTVTLSQGTGSSRISPASMVTDSNGTATFTITGSKVETVTYTAIDTTDTLNITVSQTANVTFTPYTWIVNTLDDNGNLGTLRHALANAPSGTTITFQAGLDGIITLQEQLPAISKDLIIDGSGVNVTISGDHNCRIFEINSGTVSIRNFTLTNGTVVGKGGSSSGVWGDPARGGALLITGGVVTIGKVSFNNSQVTGGNGGTGGEYGGTGGNGEGGAIYIDNGSLTITASQFIGHSANGGQGAAYTNGSYPRFGGNGGNGSGGAIFLNTGSLIITNCQFSENSVTPGSYGWGWSVNGNRNGTAKGTDIYNQDGTVTLTNVTFGPGNNNYYNSKPTDAEKSTVTTNPSSLPSDGITSSTITVILKSADGSPQGNGKCVILNQGTGSSNITAVNDGFTDSIGTATFIVRDSRAETVTYEVRDATDNVTVSRTVTVDFLPIPVVNTISPRSGPCAGGNTVIISGTGFTSSSIVRFGDKIAGYTFDSNTQITATAPSGNGTVSITVTTAGGSSDISPNGRYDYVPIPSITGINPTGGLEAGGTTVNITGTGLTDTTDVKFGSLTAASYTVNSDTSITAVSPAGSGTVNITVTTPGGTNAATAATVFSYNVVAVPVFSLAPGSYNTAQKVTITCTTSDVTIYYTVDGSTPTESSIRYDGTPVQLTSGTTTLTAVAFKTNWNPSAMISGVYTVNGTITIYQPGQNDDPQSPNQLLTAQNFENDFSVRYHTDSLWLGKSQNGNLSNIWLYYPHLFGPGLDQIPAGAKVLSAYLILNLKEFKGNPYLPHKISLYQIIDPDSLGMPYFGINGVRSGLDYRYRDHRPGRNIPWDAGNNSIQKFLSESSPVDIFETVPAVFYAEGYTHQIRLDVTKSIQSWLAGDVNQGWFLCGDHADQWTFDDGVVLSGVADPAVANRPQLVVAYVSASGDNTPPEPVTDFAATAGNELVSLSWSIPAADCSGVVIVRKVGVIPATPSDGTVVFDGFGSALIDNQGLINGKIYYYAVFAYDNLRNYSQKAWVKATPSLGLGIVPRNPSGLTVSLTGKSLNFSWVDNSDDENWFVLEQKEAEGDWIRVTSTGAGISVLSTERDNPDFALKPNTDYQYRIKAVNSFGSSGYAESAILTTPAFPAAPTGLTWRIISAGRVNLSWTNQASDATGYRIELCYNDPDKTIVKSILLAPTATTVSVTGFIPGTEYQVKVVVVKESEETAVWTDVIVTTPDDKGGIL